MDKTPAYVQTCRPADCRQLPDAAATPRSRRSFVSSSRMERRSCRQLAAKARPDTEILQKPSGHCRLRRYKNFKRVGPPFSQASRPYGTVGPSCRNDLHRFQSCNGAFKVFSVKKMKRKRTVAGTVVRSNVLLGSSRKCRRLILFSFIPASSAVLAVDRMLLM